MIDPHTLDIIAALAFGVGIGMLLALAAYAAVGPDEVYVTDDEHLAREMHYDGLRALLIVPEEDDQ